VEIQEFSTIWYEAQIEIGTYLIIETYQDSKLVDKTYFIQIMYTKNNIV